jgi:MFS family permease
MSLVAERSPPGRLGLAIVCFGLGGAVGGGVSLAVGGAVYGWLAALGGLDLPLLHHLKPWQGTFVLVALPGLPLAVLTALLFDPRQGQPRASRPGHDVGNFFREAGSLVIPLMLAVSCMNGVVVGMTYWSAPLFVRAHGWSIQQAGSTVGFVFIGGSLLGALSAGILSDHLAKSAPNRLALCMPAGAVALLAAVAFGFAPSPGAALTCLGVLQVSALLVMAMGTIALQAVAPANIRGSMNAILTTCTSLVGALAPTAIGVLNDRVFGTGAGVVVSATLFYCAMLTLAVTLLWLVQGRVRRLPWPREPAVGL